LEKKLTVSITNYIYDGLLL